MPVKLPVNLEMPINTDDLGCDMGVRIPRVSSLENLIKSAFSRCYWQEFRGFTGNVFMRSASTICQNLASKIASKKPTGIFLHDIVCDDLLHFIGLVS